MRPTMVDAFRLAVEQDRLVLEFGRSEPARAEAPAGEVTLSDRVTLDPVTVARLLHTLREALEQRAPAPAAARVEFLTPTDSLAAPSGMGAAPLNLPPDPAASASDLLLGLVRALGVPFQHERSFRFAPGSLQSNRFLISMNRADLGDAALERVLDIGRALGMPPAAQALAREKFDTASNLHFGFEAGDSAILCKLYLERRVPEDEVARVAERGEAALLHLAFKWDVDTGAHVVTRYDWFPGLSAQGIAARLRALYGDAANAESLQIALDTLVLASGRAQGQDLQYLEVHEPDNGRRSFDLNLYDAGLMVRDLLPLLLRMRDVHGIRPGHFQALVDQIRSRALGHLAGGVHRDGRDFFNVYYGVAGFPQYASRLG